MIDNLDPFGEENGSRRVENETYEIPGSDVPRNVQMDKAEIPTKTFIQM
jgi:hypothetical protein